MLNMLVPVAAHRVEPELGGGGAVEWVLRDRDHDASQRLTGGHRHHQHRLKDAHVHVQHMTSGSIRLLMCTCRLVQVTHILVQVLLWKVYLYMYTNYIHSAQVAMA